MKSLRRCVVGAGAVALATVGATREASASGFANTRIGGEEGSVVATNPTALYYNPGGLGFSSGSQLGLYGSLALRHATYTRSPSSTDVAAPPDAAALGNNGEAHLLNAFGGPTLAGSLKIGNLVLGAGFFAPFYGRAHWAQNPEFENSKFPLAAAGPQRWFSIDGALSVLYFTTGIAYRLGPISIGAAFNLVSTTIDQTQAKNPTGQGLADTTAEGRIFIDANAFTASFGAGAMLEAIPDQLWLGASYQSSPGGWPSRPSARRPRSRVSKRSWLVALDWTSLTYDVDFHQHLPDIIRGGVRWRVKNAPLEFRLFGDITRWSAFGFQCLHIQGYGCAINSDGSDQAGGTQQYVNRNWNDSYGGRLGISYWVNPAIELLVGAGYETAAVPDATLAPDIPDANNISGTLGARFRLTDSLFLSTEYTHIQYMKRDTTGKSTLAVDASGTPISVPTVEEDSGGVYTQWIGVFTGNLEALF